MDKKFWEIYWDVLYGKHSIKELKEDCDALLKNYGYIPDNFKTYYNIMTKYINDKRRH
jgi:hypothetical protein